MVELTKEHILIKIYLENLNQKVRENYENEPKNRTPKRCRDTKSGK